MSYYAYTAEYNSGYYIYMFSVNSSNGSWTPLSPSTIDLRSIDTNSGSINIITTKINSVNYVYVLWSTSNNNIFIITYYVNSSNGQLIYVSNYSYTIGAVNNEPLFMSIILKNNNYYLYVSNSQVNTISMFSINSTNGVVSPLSPFTIANVNNGRSFINTINTSSGSYAYVTAYGTNNNKSMYSISISGQLVPLSPSTISGGGYFIYIATINNTNYVYVGTNLNYISMYSISISGQLVPFMPSSVTTGNTPYYIITPNVNGTTYAYVTNGNDSTISMYSVSTSGELVPLTPHTVATDASGNPQFIISTIINSTTYVYVANYITNKVSMYSVSTSGGLVPLSPSTVATDTNGNPNYIAIATINSNQYAYVTNYNTKTVSMYSISASGGLVPLSPSTVATDINGNPISIITTIINGTNYAYVINTNNYTVYKYSISNSGILSLSSINNSFGTYITAMAITTINSVSYAYIGLFSDGPNISIYSISTSGELLYSSFIDVIDYVQTIKITTVNSVNYAYVVINGTNGFGSDGNVYMYSIANDGSLTPLVYTYVYTGTSPYSLSITTINSINYAYIVNQQDNTVSMYSIDSTNGIWNLFSTVTSGEGTNSITMFTTTQGNFLYATNQNNSTISMYSISSNGSLVALSPYIVSTGGLNNPQYIMIYTIKNTTYAYVSNYGAGISVYSISNNGQLNALTPISTASNYNYSIVLVNFQPVPVPFLSGNYTFTHAKYTR
jgi:6-phosphogluconolactonase